MHYYLFSKLYSDFFFIVDDGITIESTSNDHGEFVDTALSSTNQEFVICKKEQSISIAGPSTIVFETSTPQIHYSSGINTFFFFF